MSLKEKILAFMQEEAYCPLTAEDLADELNVKAKELSEFWQVLKELEENADIIKTRYDKYGVPARMNLVVGRFSATSKGFGFVISDNIEDAQQGDVFIPPDAIMNAMHNDKVVARVHRIKSGQGGRSREGEIIRIVSRANKRVVGRFEANRNYGFVIPDDHRIGHDIFIAKEDVNGARDGMKVVAEVTQWPEKRRSAEGRILEILGRKGEPGVEILSIIKTHNLPTEFPDEVERAANRMADVVGEEELTGRRDLRNLPIVTIDSEDAKDLDDGVHVERLANGRYLLGVHIADVSHYVRENTPLDKEALDRATSVYLVDRVLPMLPRKLSNGICSLNAGVDRLALSIHMEINHKGQVVNYEIFPSVIHVMKRLSYNIVRKILVDHDAELRTEYQDLLPQLENMERLCLILRDRRMRRGAIDFDFPELKIKLDDQGRPLEILKRIRSLSESIIEEFMLVANETVAEHMYRLKVPFVFRVHEEPEPEKMEKLNILLNNFGQHLTKVDGVQPMALQQVLHRISGRPEERIISTVMLRSLKQARYEAENLGHFGLAATHYTHFTSPIRRYPDLIVHRIIRETFNSGDISAKRRQKLAGMLPEIAMHCSQRERAAAEAERETVNLKAVEYMAQFAGEEFTGIVNGVTAFGVFVEIENGVEGLVRVSSMEDDYYRYVEEQYALIGERTRKIYRLGDAVKVILTSVNVDERNINFVLAPDNIAKVYVGKGGTAKGKTGGKAHGKPSGKAPGKSPAQMLSDAVQKNKKGPANNKKGRSNKGSKKR